MDVGFLQIVVPAGVLVILAWLAFGQPRPKIARIGSGALWRIAVVKEAGQPDRVALDRGCEHRIEPHEAFALATLLDEAARLCEAPSSAESPSR